MTRLLSKAAWLFLSQRLIQDVERTRMRLAWCHWGSGNRMLRVTLGTDRTRHKHPGQAGHKQVQDGERPPSRQEPPWLTQEEPQQCSALEDGNRENCRNQRGHSGKSETAPWSGPSSLSLRPSLPHCTQSRGWAVSQAMTQEDEEETDQTPSSL